MESNRTEQLLEETVKWLRVLAAPTVRSWLEPVLTTTEDRRVYQASVGNGRAEVAAAAGVSGGTVSNYWKKWATANPAIVEETDVSGRFRRLYDLHEVNLAVEVT